MDQDTEIETTSLNISALHAAIVDVDIVVGSVELSVSELGHLKRGSVIELDRQVGELVDVAVDGEVVARGELVNVDGRLGVRITAISGR
jgi:flagellar motor switch protein FliN/FliY